MELYFERHDGQAVTCDDFVQAMADANPASALASTWRSSSAGTARPARPSSPRRALGRRRADLHPDAVAKLPAHARPARQAAQLIPCAWACWARRRDLPLNLQAARCAATCRADQPEPRWCSPASRKARALAAARLLGPGGAGDGRHAELLMHRWRTTATPSTAGKPASAWRCAWRWRSWPPVATWPRPPHDAHLAALRAVLREPAWTPPSRTWP
jgi:aminopeptidase N